MNSLLTKLHRASFLLHNGPTLTTLLTCTTLVLPGLSHASYSVETSWRLSDEDSISDLVISASLQAEHASMSYELIQCSSNANCSSLTFEDIKDKIPMDSSPIGYSTYPQLRPGEMGYLLNIDIVDPANSSSDAVLGFLRDVAIAVPNGNLAHDDTFMWSGDECSTTEDYARTCLTQPSTNIPEYYSQLSNHTKPSLAEIIVLLDLSSGVNVYEGTPHAPDVHKGTNCSDQALGWLSDQGITTTQVMPTCLLLYLPQPLDEATIDADGQLGIRSPGLSSSDIVGPEENDGLRTCNDPDGATGCRPSPSAPRRADSPSARRWPRTPRPPAGRSRSRSTPPCTRHRRRTSTRGTARGSGRSPCASRASSRTRRGTACCRARASSSRAGSSRGAR